MLVDYRAKYKNRWAIMKFWSKCSGEFIWNLNHGVSVVFRSKFKKEIYIFVSCSIALRLVTLFSNIRFFSYLCTLKFKILANNYDYSC